jgi:hypothetical protein
MPITLGSSGGGAASPVNFTAEGGNGADPHWAAVSLLLPFNTFDPRNVFNDASSKGKIVLGSDPPPAISTDTYKYGNGALSIPAAVGGKDLIVQNDIDLKFGTGNFTVEGHFLPALNGTNGRIFYNMGVNAAGGLALGVSKDQVFFRRNGTTDLTAVVDLSPTLFTHIAFIQESGTQKIFVAGQLVASAALAIDINDTSSIHIGSNPGWFSDEFRYYGLLDSLRITKGVARNTGDNYPDPGEYLLAGSITGTIENNSGVSALRLVALNAETGRKLGETTTTSNAYTIHCDEPDPCIVILMPRDAADYGAFTPVSRLATPS